MGGRMLLGSPRPASRRARRSAIKTTTIRDFDGGWNVIDNELTLSPRFARIFDNLQRAPDGSVTVRPGYELWKDLQTGTTTTEWLDLVGEPVSGDRVMKVYHGAHGLVAGNHVTYSDMTPSSLVIDTDQLNSTHQIREVVDANSYRIALPSPATATASIGFTGTVIRDTHLIGGNVIAATYFQDHLIIVSDAGEVVKISDEGEATRIWSQAHALALSGTPIGWSQTELVSFHVNSGVLLIHNDVDKPLDVDLARAPNVVFLGDPASGGSNAAVPLGHIGFTSGGYAIIAGTSGDESLLQFSASLAPGVYTGNPAPDDATDVDLSKYLNISDPEIIGLTELRDRLLVIFRNAVAIGVLGETKTVGSDVIHDPTFKDTIPQHGTISHRSIVALGNDVFMCDRVGVPSIAQSQLVNTLVPERVSDLIEPNLQKNINRLSDDTLKHKVFAIYNSQERQYMLFMPKYDAEDVRKLDVDPIVFMSVLGSGKYAIRIPSHGFDEGDSIKVTGAAAVGNNGSINGTWTVSEIINDDYVVVQTDNVYSTTDDVGGGTDVVVQPINKETVGYIYTHNPKLKVKAWSRYRGLNFDYGVKTPNGTLLFGKGGKIFRFGDRNNPITSDAGQPITFTWELPWADFDKRVHIKEISAIYFDTIGTAQYNFRLFTDLLYKDASGTLTPTRSTAFTGANSGGFGAGTQPYGGGRRGKEQLVWPVPVVGKLFKIRIEGEATQPLRIVALSMLYREGMIGR
jgi:hypothetical protein